MKIKTLMKNTLNAILKEIVSTNEKSYIKFYRKLIT